jgi:proline iminopeptidase
MRTQVIRWLITLAFGLPGVVGQQTQAPKNPSLAERARQFRSADGTVLAYAEKGSGRVLVLLAGGYGLSHGYMSSVADGMAASNRCILPDQRGTGLSKVRDYSASTLNIAKLIEDLDALRTHLRLQKLRLLGHSWGGMLAMSYAAAHPERVESIVLVDSGGMNLNFQPLYSSGTAARLRAVLSSDEQDRLRILMAGDAPMTEIAKAEISHLRMAAFLFDRNRAAELEKYFDRAPINEEAAEAVVADLKRRKWDVRAELRNLHAPVLIIHGREDPLPLSVAQETQQTIPGARLEVIGDCGHYPWLDQPAQFFALVKRFGAAASSR